MSYLKIVSYLYLAVVAYCIYDGIMRMQRNEDYKISFIFGGIALFMFFFRMRFAKKMQDKNKGN